VSESDAIRDAGSQGIHNGPVVDFDVRAAAFLSRALQLKDAVKQTPVPGPVFVRPRWPPFNLPRKRFPLGFKAVGHPR
jgi:hypothetical protein